MSTFAEDVVADITNSFLNTNEFATSVTYTVASSRAASTITVITDEQVGALDDKENMTVNISHADVAAPVRGDSFVLGGTTWFLVDIRSDDQAMWEIRCMSFVTES